MVLRASLLLVPLLITGVVLGNLSLQRVSATVTPAASVSPANFTLKAMVEGWNSSTTGLPCSPGGKPTCNPTLTEFRGLTFNSTLSWGDCCTHDFALYTGGFPDTSVSSTDPCNAATTNGCVAKSGLITSAGGSVAFSFKPAVPKDDFTGTGTYEVYCQFHSSTMHGKIIVYKDPDLDKDKTVSIVDVATVAFSFGSTALPSPSPTWNIATDLNNDGRVDILDVAFVAFYYGASV